MDCCCQQDQSTVTQYSVNNGNLQNTPKIKYSFRTQQATPHHTNKHSNIYNTNYTSVNNTNTQQNTNYTSVNNTNTQQNTNYNTLHASTLINNNNNSYSPQQKQQQKMYSTVASNNQLMELQRQRQLLINQDRQLDMFYLNRIIPLEKEVEFFQHQVQVRNIQIMELEDLLAQRVKEKQSVQVNNNKNQSNHSSHNKLIVKGNMPMKQNVNLNQNIPKRQIIPVQQQQQNLPVQGPHLIHHQQQVPQNIKVIRQQPIIIPQKHTVIHQVTPTVANSQVIIRPQPIRH